MPVPHGSRASPSRPPSSRSADPAGRAASALRRPNADRRRGAAAGPADWPAQRPCSARRDPSGDVQSGCWRGAEIRPACLLWVAGVRLLSVGRVAVRSPPPRPGRPARAAPWRGRRGGCGRRARRPAPAPLPRQCAPRRGPGARASPPRAGGEACLRPEQPRQGSGGSRPPRRRCPWPPTRYATSATSACRTGRTAPSPALPPRSPPMQAGRPASRRPRPNAWQSQTARLMIPAGERWREQVVAGAVVRPAPTAPAPSGYGDNARAADDPGREVAAGWVTGSGVTRPAWSGSAGQAGGRPLGYALPRGWARVRSDLGVPTSKRPGSSQ